MNFRIRYEGPHTRELFGPFLNDRGLTGHAVEIGTHRGEFAKQLLSSWKGERLHCVDPYVNDYSETFDPAGTGDRAADRDRCVKALKLYRDRVRHIFRYSWEAEVLFESDTLDFAYVDGNHDTEAVANDLEIWWPKLRSGGVLAGHDIVCVGEENGGWGRTVQPAVFAFAEKYGGDVYLIPELQTRPWSFYFYKP